MYSVAGLEFDGSVHESDAAPLLYGRLVPTFVAVSPVTANGATSDPCPAFTACFDILFYPLVSLAVKLKGLHILPMYLQQPFE